ncbi:thermonuclease family protein [Sandarakinorhabdus sp.]|uniref:thermonuclease family protein n=1 Tax=Sandarakinorhabdus sp. TaxID=1916663 RepID=UPI003F6F81FD
MSLLALAAAATLMCVAPTHSDGDNMRCRNHKQTMRLYGIDAPEMPGSCRPGRRCVRGDPYASRDYLRRLTRGRAVKCEVRDVDRYGRSIVNCTADGVNISCAMIAARQAVPRYGKLDCRRR